MDDYILMIKHGDVKKQTESLLEIGVDSVTAELMPKMAYYLGEACVESGSLDRMEQLQKKLQEMGHESYVAYNNVPKGPLAKWLDGEITLEECRRQGRPA